MKFVQFAGLWTLVHHPSRQKEWALDHKLRAIKSAGFAGICARLDAPIASLAQGHELFSIALTFPDSPSEFPQLLKTQKAFGAQHVSVQLGTHETPPAEALKRWLRLEKEADKLEIDVSLETHRDSVTETPEKLIELADRYEEATGKTLKLTWDFSHFGVSKHLPSGQFVDRLLSRPQLVQHATIFQFRPFNSHHAQLPVTHKGELTPEVLDYLEFAQEVMHLWKIAPRNKDRDMLACPSLGPKGGYALSNFPAVWPDALRLSAELNARWAKAR